MINKVNPLLEMKIHRIISYQTHYEITNYELKDSPKLDKTLSVYNNDTHKEIPYYTYDEMRKSLYVPKGFQLSTIKENLLNSEFFYSNEINPWRNITFNMRLNPRHIQQSRAIRYLSGEGEFIYNRESSQIVLIMPGGDGKRYCMIRCVCTLIMSTIIIIYIFNVCNQ